MLAGQLRDVIAIQVRTNGDDAAGEPTLTWTTFAADVYAKVTDLSGREYVAAQAVTNAVTTTVIIRYLPGVTAAMRVLCKGVTYNIQAVIEPENRRREMHLMCVRNVSNG